MCYHHHIGLETHDTFGPVDVRRKHIFLKGGGELRPQLWGLPELRDSGIKFDMRRVVQIMQQLNGFLGAQSVSRRLGGCACIVSFLLNARTGQYSPSVLGLG